MSEFWQSGPDAAHAWLGPKYRTAQLAQWVGKGVLDPAAWTNIPTAARRTLEESPLLDCRIVSRSDSRDGSAKFLFEAEQGQFEAVWMPFDNHNTLCVSSQTGCQMGCIFCATATLRARNLNAGSILGQVARVRELGLAVDRIVFMGMGEPLHNYDNVAAALTWLHHDSFGFHPRKITVSTVGFLPRMDQFWDEQRCSLAISLNGYDAASRNDWMPVGARWSFDEIMAWISRRKEALGPYAKRRITLEYIVAAGHDEEAHAAQLAAAIGSTRVRVNLIPWNAWDGSPIRGTTEDKLNRFGAALARKGVWTTVRRSRALDVQGACGQLATSRSEGEWQQNQSVGSLSSDFGDGQIGVDAVQ